VVDSAGTVQQRKISVERSQDSLAVITAGLRDGEQVVRSGQSRLTAGAKVHITGANAGAGAGTVDTAANAEHTARAAGRKRPPSK
jgi:hypothetical protein